MCVCRRAKLCFWLDIKINGKEDEQKVSEAKESKLVHEMVKGLERHSFSRYTYS